MSIRTMRGWVGKGTCGTTFVSIVSIVSIVSALKKPICKSRKGRMEKRPKVGLDIVDPTNPWHWLSIRGNVAEITEEGANAHIDKMAKKYLGQDKYGFHQPGDVRVICKILPERVIAA